MILVRNKIIPPKGFKAIAIFPFLFYRGDPPSERTIRHEKIHFRQQIEMFILPFYLLYAILWLLYGYKENPFEREAYWNEKDPFYLETRPFWAWIKYF